MNVCKYNRSTVHDIVCTVLRYMISYALAIAASAALVVIVLTNQSEYGIYPFLLSPQNCSFDLFFFYMDMRRILTHVLLIFIRYINIDFNYNNNINIVSISCPFNIDYN